MIENVPQYLKLHLPHKGKLRTVEEILNLEFSGEYQIESQIINCADLGVPQSRKRAFIKLFPKNKTWAWPEHVKNQTLLEEVIGELPSLESGEDSGIPWHFARTHSPDHIEWMSNTPTGHSAFENPVHFPKGKDGKPIKAYNTTYRRMSWDKPAPAITMRNDAISSQMNVHPDTFNPKIGFQVSLLMNRIIRSSGLFSIRDRKFTLMHPYSKSYDLNTGRNESEPIRKIEDEFFSERIPLFGLDNKDLDMEKRLKEIISTINDLGI